MTKIITKNQPDSKSDQNSIENPSKFQYKISKFITESNYDPKLTKIQQNRPKFNRIYIEIWLIKFKSFSNSTLPAKFSKTRTNSHRKSVKIGQNRSKSNFHSNPINSIVMQFKKIYLIHSFNNRTWSKKLCVNNQQPIQCGVAKLRQPSQQSPRDGDRCIGQNKPTNLMCLFVHLSICLFVYLSICLIIGSIIEFKCQWRSCNTSGRPVASREEEEEAKSTKIVQNYNQKSAKFLIWPEFNPIPTKISTKIDQNWPKSSEKSTKIG